MGRFILIALLGVLPAFVNAQPENAFKSIRLEACTIQEQHFIKDTIYGFPFEVIEVVVNAQSKVQMSCNFGNPAANRYELVWNKLSVVSIPDISGKLKDSLLAEISSYIDERESWGNLYDVGNDFSNLPFNKSFFLSGSLIIPSIWSGAERDGDFYLYYINNTLIKIKLLEHKGMGALSSFNRQNFFLRDKGVDLILDSYVKMIDEARKIVETYKKQ
ncbi:MAG: hypothetical protein ACO1N0_10905 [Fluviicola sp.]